MGEEKKGSTLTQTKQHIAYFIGGPYDLTKRMLPVEPQKLLRMPAERYEVTANGADPMPVIDMHIYRNTGTLKAQRLAFIYEYSHA